MEINKALFQKKLLDLAKFLMDKKDNPWKDVTSGKTIFRKIKAKKFFEGNDEATIVNVLEKVAKNCIRIAISNKGGSRLTGVGNSNSLLRLARLLELFDGNSIQLSEIDALCWEDDFPESDLIFADAKQIEKGNFIDTIQSLSIIAGAESRAEDAEKNQSNNKRGRRRKNKKDDQEEETIEEEISDLFELVQDGGDDGHDDDGHDDQSWFSRNLYLLIASGFLIVGIIVFSVIMFQIAQSNSVEAETSIPAGPTINPDGTISLNNGAETEVVGEISQDPPATQTDDSNQGIFDKIFDLFQNQESPAKILLEQAFWVLILLNVITTLIILLDRVADGEVEDFKILMVALVIFSIWVALPMGKWFFSSAETLLWGDYLVFGPEVFADIIGLIILCVALLTASYAGAQDATTLSGGLFLAGNILFISYNSSFMTWHPPVIAVIVWVIGFLIHLFFSLMPDEKVGTTLGLTAFGVVLQVVVFLIILYGVETTTSVWMTENSLVISVFGSIVSVQALIGGIFILMSKTELFSEDGKMFTVFETSAFDACLQINYAFETLFFIFWPIVSDL